MTVCSTDQNSTKSARIVALRDDGHLSWAEIAEAVGCKRSNAAGLYRKAKARAATRLEKLRAEAETFLREAERQRKFEHGDSDPFSKWPAVKLWPVMGTPKDAFTEGTSGSIGASLLAALRRVPESYQVETRQKLIAALASFVIAPEPHTASVAHKHTYIRKPGFIESLKRNQEAAPVAAPEPEPEIVRPSNGKPEPPISDRVPASLVLRADGKIWTGGNF